MGKKAYCTLRSRRSQQRVRTPDLPSPYSDETKDEKEFQNSFVIDVEVHKTPRVKKIKLENNDIAACINGEATEHDLAMELLAFEKLGYLSKTDHETDDETLIQYGDKFGLSVINDYPAFFKLVPQHPHYGHTSLHHVNEANAENYWDLFMPLIHRGLSAVRNNKRKEIAAVERRVAHFTSQGFSLRHIQSYINTSRRMQEDQFSLISALEKVNAEIKVEKRKIDEVVAGKSVLVEIQCLEDEKAKYQRLIAEIDLSLTSKRKLLEEEKSIIATSTTPLYDMLLRTKEELNRRAAEMRDKAKALRIEGVVT